MQHFSGGCINGWITIGKKPHCAAMTGFAYVNDLRVMAQMAAAVTAPSAPRYAALFKARLAEYHEAFFKPENQTYGFGTQSELAMALWLGAPPSAPIRSAVAANLAADIEQMIEYTVNMTSTSASFDPNIDFVGGVGLVYLFEALAMSGHADTALKLALKTLYPSYGYMFLNELEPSTTLWECVIRVSSLGHQLAADPPRPLFCALLDADADADVVWCAVSVRCVLLVPCRAV